jgi:beta-glucanase (GH16 family)
MKQSLVENWRGKLGNIALITSATFLLISCGGGGSSQPNSNDKDGPLITLNAAGADAVIASSTNPENLIYIPESSITHSSNDTVYYTDENDVTHSHNGQIVGYREYHSLGSPYSDPGATANDLYSGGVPASTEDGTINHNNTEQQEIVYTATDANGNTSTFTRFITLVDEIPPTVTVLGDKSQLVTIGASASFTDPGSNGVDNVANNIDSTKTSTTIHKLSNGVSTVVNEIPVDRVGNYRITYSYTDTSGNEASNTRDVFVRNPFNDRQPIFENGNVDSTWTNGISAYDQGLPNWGSCSVGYGCPNLKWESLIDSDSSRPNQVLQITHLNNNLEAGLYISSSTGIDLRGSEETGLLQMDVKRVSGSDPYIDIWADCGYPCAGGPSRQGPFETGEWTTIYIPIKDIMEGPTSLLDLSIVKAGLLFKAASARDAVYRLDNVVWLCEDACQGSDEPHVPVDWASTHEDPAIGYDAPTSYDGYTLVWNDEFNGNMVNPANWGFDIGNGDNGWGNGELQHYKEENASVEDGLLIIEAKKHQPKIQPGDIGYTSAKLKSEDLFEFKYGRVDARAVPAKGQGLWSAIWMLGANHSEVGWPRSGEIDILDTIAGTRDGFPQEAMLVNNMYWNAEGSSAEAAYSLGSINQNGSAEFWLNEPLTGEMVTEDGNEVPYQRPALWDVNDLPGWMAGPKLTDPDTGETVRPLLLDVDNLPEWIINDPAWINWLADGGSTETFSNKFHVFSLIWTEDRIVFEVDGVETNSINIQNALTEHYRQTFYLILNVAVGGNWPKAPSSDTPFPDGMLVDYVRVYQADTDGDGVADHDWDGETVLDNFPNDAAQQ